MPKIIQSISRLAYCLLSNSHYDASNNSVSILKKYLPYPSLKNFLQLFFAWRRSSGLHVRILSWLITHPHVEHPGNTGTGFKWSPGSQPALTIAYCKP
jgi:hypothetical protein